MKAGNIIKLNEQYNIHSEGTLGVLVKSNKCQHLINELLTLIMEDGNYFTFTGNEPYSFVGYNSDFDDSQNEVEAFDECHYQVKILGREAFTNFEDCYSADVVLTDNADRKTSFTVGFDCDGNYFETYPTIDGEDQGSHTINAYIGGISIDVDGNAWRDLESGGYMPEFLSLVALGDRNPEEFFVNISEALGSPVHGIVL